VIDFFAVAAGVCVFVGFDLGAVIVCLLFETEGMPIATTVEVAIYCYLAMCHVRSRNPHALGFKSGNHRPWQATAASMRAARRRSDLCSDDLLGLSVACSQTQAHAHAQTWGSSQRQRQRQRQRA
jgi:hypothetical protein